MKTGIFWVLYFVGILIVGVASCAAQAEEKTLTWTPPTTREDGKKLPPGEINGYNLFESGKQFAWTKETKYKIDLAPGKHCFTVRTLDTNKLTSKDSNKVCVTILPPLPAHPGAPVVKFFKESKQ